MSDVEEEQFEEEPAAEEAVGEVQESQGSGELPDVPEGAEEEAEKADTSGDGVPEVKVEGEEEKKDEEKDDEDKEDKEKAEGEEEQKPEEEEEKPPDMPLSYEMMAECLSLLCKVGDGLAHAYVRVALHERNVTSIELLRNYIHLRYVDFSKNAIRDVAPLTALKYLLTLKLEENSISKLEPLQPLPYLQDLNVSRNRLISLEGGNHPLLEHLNASFNQMRIVRGLRPAMLSRLHTLELRGNKLENVEGEAMFLPSLKHLFLAQNQLTRVDGLARLENLTTLHLRENNIEKLDSFTAPALGGVAGGGGAMDPLSMLNAGGGSAATQGFRRLEYLNMRGNRIASLKEVAKLKKLPAIKAIVMSENPISEESDYRMETLMACRRLVRLDKDTFTDEEREEATQLAEQRLQEELANLQMQQQATEGTGGGTDLSGSAIAGPTDDGAAPTSSAPGTLEQEPTGASSVLGELPDV